jgi:hypothetical protein
MFKIKFIGAFNSSKQGICDLLCPLLTAPQLSQTIYHCYQRKRNVNGTIKVQTQEKKT